MRAFGYLTTNVYGLSTLLRLRLRLLARPQERNGAPYVVTREPLGRQTGKTVVSMIPRGRYGRSGVLQRCWYVLVAARGGTPTDLIIDASCRHKHD
jgi:hypothetical protein